MSKKEIVTYRSYTRHQYKGPLILVAWIQNRCKKCQRFLKKHQSKYCSNCGHKESRATWNRNNKEYRHQYYLVHKRT